MGFGFGTRHHGGGATTTKAGAAMSARRHFRRPSLSHVLIVHLLSCALINECGPAAALAVTLTVEAFATDRYRPHSRSLIIGASRSSSEQPIDDIATQRVDPLAVPLVNAFYKAHKYKGRAKRSDIVFVARRSSASTSASGEIVGAVRLVPKTADTYFVRNLFVAEVCRRRGVGKLLMKAALEGNTVGNNNNNNNNNKQNEDDSFRYYCFLRRELSPIYRAAGLDVIDCQGPNLPDWIREEYLRIRHQQGDLILMGKGILVLPRD